MTDNEHVCPICGEPTLKYYGNYRKDGLCSQHGRMANANQIEQCDKCGKWHNTGEACACQHVNVPEHVASTLTCLLCGADSNGKHFCKSCYAKYKDKAIDIRIKNCKDIEVLDKYGNATYKCDDGRKVRSKSEKIISDFLFKYKIRTVYEKTVYYYPDNGEPIALHPDFYLLDYDIYIEHNGYNGKKYAETKAFTEEAYKKLGFNVIITSEDDMNDIEACLKPKLKLN
ncbi:MAG: hypothetical protein K2N18_03470 [Clostridia bacterium]|nr:hypothetical protein [Clostridia bacterium]